MSKDTLIEKLINQLPSAQAGGSKLMVNREAVIDIIRQHEAEQPEERRAQSATGTQETRAARTEASSTLNQAAYEQAEITFTAVSLSCGETGKWPLKEAIRAYLDALPSEIRLTKEQWADSILAGFKTEGDRTKAEEWEAAFAMLFKQFTELQAQKREAQPLEISENEIAALRNFKEYVHKRRTMLAYQLTQRASIQSTAAV